MQNPLELALCLLDEANNKVEEAYQLVAADVSMEVTASTVDDILARLEDAMFDLRIELTQTRNS